MRIFTHACIYTSKVYDTYTCICTSVCNGAIIINNAVALILLRKRQRH